MKIIPFGSFTDKNNRELSVMVLSLTKEEHKEHDIIVLFEKPDAVYGF